MTTSIEVEAITQFANMQRRALITSLLVFTVVGMALLFSAYRLNTLRAEVAHLDMEINAKKQRLADVQAEFAATQERAKHAQQALLQTTGNNPQATMQKIESSINQNTAELVPRIYIHISSEAQREVALRAMSELQKQAYLAPGIQNVGEYTPPRTELRYFSEQDLKEAQKIQTLLHNIGIDARLVYLPQFSSRVRPHHFEVWFARL